MSALLGFRPCLEIGSCGLTPAGAVLGVSVPGHVPRRGRTGLARAARLQGRAGSWARALGWRLPARPPETTAAGNAGCGKPGISRRAKALWKEGGHFWVQYWW